jgi:hypothetical protein
VLVMLPQPAGYERSLPDRRLAKHNECVASFGVRAVSLKLSVALCWPRCLPKRVDTSRNPAALTDEGGLRLPGWQ